MMNHLTNLHGKDLQQAEKELGIEVKVIESKQASEYIANIETLSR